jgi:cytochrome P450
LSYPGASFWTIRSQPPDPLAFLEELAGRGDVVPFTLGTRRAVLLNRPDHVGMVLVSHAARFQKGSAIARARHLLGNGLLTADAALNKERRKIAQPAFSRPHLDGCAEVIVSRARDAAGRWREGELIDVTRAFGRLTFGIVGEAIVGADVAAEFEDVREAVSEATATLDPLLSLVAPVRRVHRAQARLRSLVARMVQRSSGSAASGTLLALVNAHEATPSSREQRIDDVLTVLLAGHDTITSALTWAFALVSRHPHTRAALRQELKTVLAGREARTDDISRLAYTRAVLAESLRLYPPAWVLARQAIAPHRFDGVEVASGTIVLMSQYLLHRDRRSFDRPLEFRPERWLDQPSELPKGAYFPFGAGPRSCIGESFGWMEGVLLLATISQRWDLALVDDRVPEPEARITMRPRSRVLMLLRSHS